MTRRNPVAPLLAPLLAPGPPRRSTFDRRIGVRPGLAPLELVLWIPILLMVAALMVVYGTSVSWRIRGEVASRDAVWRVLTPRTGANEPRPVAATWPHADGGATYGFRDDDRQLTLLDDPAIDHPVVRGPLDQGWEVTGILDPDATGLIRGTTSIQRPYPMLARLGSYRSGEIGHPILDHPWTIGGSFRRGVLLWPNEIGGYRPWSIVPDVFRRTTLLYRFPIAAGGRAAFEAVVSEAIDAVQGPGLSVLDADQEIAHYRGAPVDFHPRGSIQCELDPEIVRDRGMERHVIDWIFVRPPEEVQLGGVTQLPRRLTEFFLSMFRGRIAEIERLIEEGEATAADLAELAQLEVKQSQLEDYQDRMGQIEESLRDSSTARL